MAETENPDDWFFYWGTGQVIILEVSTHTFLTDPSAMDREWQFIVPSQSA